MSEARFRSYTRSWFRRRVINLHERGDAFGASKGIYRKFKKIGREDPKVVSRNQPKTSEGRPGMESMAMLMTMILITSMIEENPYIRRGSDSIIKKCFNISSEVNIRFFHKRNPLT